MSTPSEVYSELLALAHEEPGRAYRAFPAPVGLQIRVFVEGVTRLPGVTFRAPRNRVPKGMNLPKIRGAEIVISHPVTPLTTPDVIYELRAAESVYALVFMELAAALVSDASGEETVETALLRVTERVSSWARFFNARGSEALGRSAQLGLIGELLCLRTIGEIVGLQNAIESWKGPTGTPHDFEAMGGAIEAKLTTSAVPERVRITSERQLDDSVLPHLYLFAVIAQEAAAGSTGLASLVDELRLQVSGTAPNCLELFNERLLEVGYSETDRAKYEVRVLSRTQEFLHVTGEFPRIRPAELRPGVFSVSYEVPWSAIAPYRIPPTDIRRIFGVVD